MSFSLSRLNGSWFARFLVICLFVFGSVYLPVESWKASAATSHNLDVQKASQFYRAGYRATPAPIDRLLSVGAQFKIQLISNRLRDSIAGSNSITVEAANSICCEWCDLQYERCMNHSGDQEFCDAQWCACMNAQQCGICPVC